MLHVYVHVGVKRYKTTLNTLSGVPLVTFFSLVFFQPAFFKLSQYLGDVKVQLLQPIDTKIKIQKSPYDKCAIIIS